MVRGSPLGVDIGRGEARKRVSQRLSLIWVPMCVALRQSPLRNRLSKRQWISHPHIHPEIHPWFHL